MEKQNGSGRMRVEKQMESGWTWVERPKGKRTEADGKWKRVGKQNGKNGGKQVEGQKRKGNHGPHHTGNGHKKKTRGRAILQGRHHQ